jgi:hypothetical protein
LPSLLPTLTRLGLALALLLLVCLRDGADLAVVRTQQAAAPWAFSLLDWEARAVGQHLGSIWQALSGRQPPADQDDVETLLRYFRSTPSTRVDQRRGAEAAIQRLVTDALSDEGLASPLPGTGVPALFPPVSFAFTEPPAVLIVSPRERIEVSQYVLLEPSMRLDEIEQLERSVAERGWSSLVTPIGGLATYPSMVLEGGDAESTLAAVAHEWVHAYFFFQPLGRGYWSDQELRTINETAAELAGRELGRHLALRLGLPPRPPLPPRTSDFNRLMRQTRLEVDRLLVEHQVEQAEQLMEQRRLELNRLGYAIRRLNQAYFAFHGSYAEGPAGSSPVAGQIRRLRERSAGLGDFLRAVATVSSPADLRALAG